MHTFNTCSVATTKRRARWNTSSSGQSGCCACTRAATTLCHRKNRIPNVNKAGFWFVRGSPSTSQKKVYSMSNSNSHYKIPNLKQSGHFAKVSTFSNRAQTLGVYKTYRKVFPDSSCEAHEGQVSWKVGPSLYSLLEVFQFHLWEMFHSEMSAWHSPKLHLCCRWNCHQSMQSCGLSATWYITQTAICTPFNAARLYTTNEIRECKISSSQCSVAEKSDVGYDAASGEWFLALQRTTVPSPSKLTQSKENSQSS